MEPSEVQAATVIGPAAPPAAPASSALDATDTHSEDEHKISSVPPPRILGPSMPSGTQSPQIIFSFFFRLCFAADRKSFHGA
jgi:hypothetical protein